MSLPNKMSFLIDDLLRDTHDRATTSANTPAVVTTGFPRYCFPSIYTTVSSSSWESTKRDSPHFADIPDALALSQPSKNRPTFSIAQVQTLKSVFAFKHYLGKAERKQLAADLNMTDEQVKTWFQNKRTKLKKKMSQVDNHYAELMYYNDIANGLPRGHLRLHTPPGYHSSHHGFPVAQRDIDL